MIENYYNLSVEESISALGSSRNGLLDNEVKARRERYGRNILSKEKRTSKLSLFISNFKSSLVYVLLFASVISLFMGHVLDALVIMIVVFANAVIGYYLEGKAEKALKNLKKLSIEKAIVIREGDHQRTNSSELVPGDVIALREGDKVPADARIIKSYDLRVDESTFTGESVPKEKNNKIIKENKNILDRNNILYMGTIIVSGNALALTTKTGMKTELGKITDLYKDELLNKTPLQKKLDRFSKYLGLSVIAIAILIFLIGILTGQDMVRMIQTSVSLAVSAIPEGLPVAIAVILSMGIYKMSKQNAVVKKMTAVETLGRVSVICTDKTGTLTYNQLRTSMINVDAKVEITGEGYSAKGRFLFKKRGGIIKERLSKIMEISILCNDSKLKQKKGRWEIIGDPVEGALYIAAEKYGFDLDTIKKEFPREAELTFNSKSKYMATLNGVSDTKMLCVKGAAEIIIERSSFFHDRAGKKVNLTKRKKIRFLKEAENLSKDGLKVIAVAYRDEKATKKTVKDSDVKELVLVGLMGLIDASRKEAKEAVEKAKGAGIRVIMLTGDHLETAKKIGRDLDIIKTDDEAMLAEDLHKLHGKDLEEAIKKATVYARVTPEIKYKIVEKLQEYDEVVAMTGDGINDVPAIAKADVGIAMGVSGTAAARDASDLVLMDDNFATIITAVDKGRTIFSNIRKVLYYLLSTNLGEVFTILFALLLGIPLPVTAIMILWINLITDGFFTVPVGLMAPEGNNLKKPPRQKDDGLVPSLIKKRILFVSLIIAVSTIVIFMISLPKGIIYAQTMAFMTLVVAQWFNAFNARSETASGLTKILKDKFILYAFGGAFLVQLLVIYNPYMNTVFGTVPLDLSDWTKIVGVSFLVIVFVEIEKLLRRTKTKKLAEERKGLEPAST